MYQTPGTHIITYGPLKYNTIVAPLSAITQPNASDNWRSVFSAVWWNCGPHAALVRKHLAGFRHEMPV